MDGNKDTDNVLRLFERKTSHVMIGLVDLCQQTERALKRPEDFAKYEVTQEVLAEFIDLHGLEEIKSWIAWIPCLGYYRIKIPRGVDSWEKRIRSAWRLYRESKSNHG